MEANKTECETGNRTRQRMDSRSNLTIFVKQFIAEIQNFLLRRDAFF